MSTESPHQSPSRNSSGTTPHEVRGRVRNIRDLTVTTLLGSLIKVQDIPEVLPLGRNGAKLAMSTVWRWRRRGRAGRKLSVITIAGVAYVRIDDLVAFLVPEAQEQADPTKQSTAHSKGQDDPRHEAVESVLAQEFGV